MLARKQRVISFQFRWRKKYYVSFIDDYSKFTWIYLLKYKFEVFQKFQEFQTMVERLFDRKIISMQIDWEEFIKGYTSFLIKSAYLIMSLALMYISKMAQ